jgi:hypothetical protein
MTQYITSRYVRQKALSIGYLTDPEEAIEAEISLYRTRNCQDPIGLAEAVLQNLPNRFTNSDGGTDD